MFPVLVRHFLVRHSVDFLCWFGLFVLFANSVGHGQEERWELGKRLRRFEIAWQTADSNGRTRCVRPMQKAVENFFSLRLTAAAKELDEAFFVVANNTTPSDFERYAISRRVSFGPVLIDTNASTIELKVAPFYKVDMPPPADAVLRVECATQIMPSSDRMSS